MEEMSAQDTVSSRVLLQCFGLNSSPHMLTWMCGALIIHKSAEITSVKQNEAHWRDCKHKGRWSGKGGEFMQSKRNMRQMVICWLIFHPTPFAHLHSSQAWSPKLNFLPLFMCVWFPTSPLICFSSLSPLKTIFLCPNSGLPALRGSQKSDVVNI